MLSVLEDCSAYLNFWGNLLFSSSREAPSGTQIHSGRRIMCICMNNLFRLRNRNGVLAGIIFELSLLYSSVRLSQIVSPTCSTAGAGGLLASAVPTRGLRVYRGAWGRVLSPLCHRPLPGRHHPQRHHQDVHRRAQHLTLQWLLLD